MGLLTSRPSIPARVLSEAEWEQLEETPYNPPDPDLSEETFNAEFETVEAGLTSLLEEFGRNSAEDGDFFYDGTVSNGSRAICFELLHRSKLRTPKLIPAILDFLKALPLAYSVGMQSDEFSDYIYVRREGVLVHDCGKRTLKAFGLKHGK